jgi:hypothetical protein
MDRASAPAERLDVHVAIAPSAGISEEQIIDTLSYAAEYYETQGLSLGTVTFEYLAEYSTVDLDAEAAELFRAPRRTGASTRAITVIFVRDIVGPTGEDVGTVGLSSGLPGLLGTAGTSGSGVVVETAFALDDTSKTYAERLQLLGLDVAHEVGHYLGLRHTSEIEVQPGQQRAHDFLTDTPQCDPQTNLTPSGCEAFGRSNVMFPILSDYPGATFSDQQGQVLAGVAPRAATSCTDHSQCRTDEICNAATYTCERAWAREYEFSVYGAQASTSVGWDFGGSPDLYASYIAGDSQGTTNTVSDNHTAYWYASSNFTALKSASELYVAVYDEDVTSDELVGQFYVPAPMSVAYLRSPQYSLYGDNVTALIGFQPL